MAYLFAYRGGNVLSNLDEAASARLVDAVLSGTLVREKVFRDNWRTLSARVCFEDRSLVLKIPRARNGREWERFLTRFRESDALRSFHHLELMRAMGFCAPKAVLAYEQRTKGVVTYSFVCYLFVDGRIAKVEDAPEILAALRALHKQGYTRSDAQLANFLMDEKKVTFIDFRLKKPLLLPNLQKNRELSRFFRSCPEARSLISAEQARSKWLWAAELLESFSFSLRNLKRYFRSKK